MVDIVEVKSRKQLKEFIYFPFRLYEDNPYWVPPLIMDEYNTLDKRKNPAFEYCDAKYWLAYKNGELVGRIAGIQNHAYVEKWDNKYTRFGWIDFIDDTEVSKALLKTVENWAAEQGMEAVHGPLGFCDLDKQGMLVEGFEEMGSIITYYHHPYYKEHMKLHGYKKDVDWFEFEIDLDKFDQEDRLNKVSERALEKEGLSILHVKHRNEFKPYFKEIFEVLDIAFKDLYGVVELTDKQVKTYIEQYFSFANPDYICLIVDENKRLAGFGICFPSFAKTVKKHNGKLLPFGFIDILKDIKKNDTLDLYLVGVRPEYKKIGVPAAMVNYCLKNALKNGIKKAIASPQLENNHAVHSLWRFFDARMHRRRTCFIKKIKK
jgi:GNAT superfamily N-acetyltransferase